MGLWEHALHVTQVSVSVAVHCHFHNKRTLPLKFYEICCWIPNAEACLAHKLEASTRRPSFFFEKFAAILAYIHAVPHMLYPKDYVINGQGDYLPPKAFP